MNRKKIETQILAIITILVMTLIFQHISYAADITGWAGLTDEESEAMAEEQEKHQAEYDYNKSSNNYLKSLSIEGYTLLPEFDKQTVNYQIKKEIASSQVVKITAEAEDEKATITGTGDVSLQPGKNMIEINVTAESGTVKTYFIEIQTTGENVETNTSAVVDNQIVTTSTENIEPPVKQTTGEETKKIIIFFTIFVIIILLLIFLPSKKKKKQRNKKSKH